MRSPVLICTRFTVWYSVKHSGDLFFFQAYFFRSYFLRDIKKEELFICFNFMCFLDIITIIYFILLNYSFETKIISLNLFTSENKQTRGLRVTVPYDFCQLCCCSFPLCTFYRSCICNYGWIYLLILSLFAAESQFKVVKKIQAKCYAFRQSMLMSNLFTGT